MRFALAIAYLVAGLLVWQAAVSEVVLAHDEAVEACEAESEGDCDCGGACHGCFECAHHATPGVVDPTVAALDVRLLDFVELPSFDPDRDPRDADISPPLKVPKHLA
jgi:hypothetical protein